MTRALKVVIPSRGVGEGPLNCAVDHSEYRACQYESVGGPSLRSG
jgi:hypothetical protein